MLAHQARFRGARTLLQAPLALEFLAIESVLVGSAGRQRAFLEVSSGASRRFHAGWGLSSVPLAVRPLLVAPRAEDLIAGWLRQQRQGFSTGQTPPRVGVRLNSAADNEEQVSPPHRCLDIRGLASASPNHLLLYCRVGRTRSRQGA